MGNEVSKTNTPWNRAQLVTLLRRAGLPEVGLPFALAQISLETANGRGCWNHNVGNISQYPSSPTDYWVPPWVRNEADPLHDDWLRHEVPGAFKAYPSLAAGVSDYWARLRNDFPEIVRAWTTGDPAQVFAAIRQHYMPDKMSPQKAAASLANFTSLHDAAREFLGLPKAPARVVVTPGPCLSLAWPPVRLLRLGCSGPDVYELQKRLGLDPGKGATPTPGKFDDATDAATRRYQRANPPLVIDGIAGPKTCGKLGK